MKHLILTLLLGLGLQLAGSSQDNNPSILTHPSDWEYEFIAFPLDFAPELKYEGFEELRFADGMFDVNAPAYFTYIFAISLDGKHDFSIPQSKAFLLEYFQGLSYSVAKSKESESTLDTTKIDVVVEQPKVKTGVHDAYFIKVNFIDTFTNGQEIDLNMELVILKPKTIEKTYLLALVSPQPKYSEVWKELYTYRKLLMEENAVLKAAREN